jgi:hypothetical protein
MTENTSARGSACAMNESSPFLHCAHCGDRIGVYEPVWLEYADGSVVESTLLSLGDPRALTADGARLLHDECRAQRQALAST